MPAPAYLRKQFKGGVPATTLSGAITNSSTTISIASATGWPDGASFPFVVTIDRGQASEEQVLIASRSGTTLTVYSDGRGYGETVAASHSSGATIEHTLDVGTIDQANRLANLMTAVKQIIGHNGTNPVAVTGVTDGHVLQVRGSEASGLVFDRLIALLVQAGAPSVTGVQRIWHDTTLDRHRVSDGTSWLFDLDWFVFADIAARKTGLASPVAGQACMLGGNILEVYNGTAFRTVGTPRFANATARDAYYADATVGLYDGAKAKTLDDYAEWEYRQDEWIRRNAKITVSASAPVDPHDGDLWFQPVS